MSLELIGYENLPNAFIEKISLYDYGPNEIKINISVRIHDLNNESVWFNTSADLTKLLRVALVMSTSEKQTTELSTGNLLPLSISSDMIMSSAIPTPRKDKDGLIFDISFNKIMDLNVKHLSVFCFCFISRSQITETFGVSLQQDYYGPIKSEIIFNNSNILRTTNVFVRSNGEYWPGPVHAQGAGFMVGSYHTSQEHEKLTKLTVSNTKVKDYRSTSRSLRQGSESSKNFSSDLIVSYSSDTDINCMFMLNTKSILKSNTKFGSFLNKAAPSVITELLDSFKINLFTIQRQRVQTNLQPTTLRSKKKITQKIFSKKNIIKSYDINGVIRNSTRLERRGNFDIVESEIRSKPTSPDRKKQEIFKEDLGDYKKISMIKELFFDYGDEIRTFQFNDYELTKKTPGDYKYKVAIHFTDPTYSFVYNVVKLIKSQLSDIKNYLSTVSRKNTQELTFDVETTVNSYIKYYSYIYNISKPEKNKLALKMFNMLDIKTASVASIKNFQKQYLDLYSEFISFLDTDPNEIFANKGRASTTSKNQTTSRIIIEKTFDKIISPSSNSVGFGYIDGSKQSSMKIFSKRQIQERANQETEKNYVEQPNSSSPSYTEETNTGINDLTTVSTAFFSPVQMATAERSIPIGFDSTVDYSEVNMVVDTSKKFGLIGSGFKVQPPSFSTETSAEEIVETGETFVASSKIIGSNQSFVTYSDISDSYSVSDVQSKSQDNFVNAIGGFKNDRTFEATLSAAKQLSGAEARQIPNQLKAVINGKTSATRTNYVTSSLDLLANPKTKNYYELNNFSVQRLIYVEAFMRDKDENILLNKPVYKTMDFNNFQLTNKPVVCFLESYTNNKFKISDTNKVSVVDSSFIMSDRDLTVKKISQVSDDNPLYSTQDISYEFMNSNIVKQINQAMVGAVDRQQQAPSVPQATLQTTVTAPLNLNQTINVAPTTPGSY